MRRRHLAMMVIYTVGLAALLSFSFVAEVSAFNEHDLLTRQIKATAIKGESIAQVLDLLVSEYDIPLGIELGDEKRTPSRKIDLDLPLTNLKDFLDSVIAKDPRYTWKLEGGVIHVWPVTGRDTLLATLLEEKISHFSIIGDASRYAIYNDIMDLPEIRSKLVIAGVEPMIFLASGSMTKLAKETSFNESNLTLRELLDRIVLKTEIRQWVISRWGKNNEYISLKGG
ncbi:MAG TPA: hypothetical protein VF290_16810 [Pyrinomonadaceae bacterium]